MRAINKGQAARLRRRRARYCWREQDGAEAMQVASDDSQGDVALEAVDAMIGTAIQSLRLQGGDGRFHGAVAATQTKEFGVALALALGRGAFALVSNAKGKT